ncbi:hypothetical protein [Bradyrhizobium sp. UFLA05-112]
MRQFCAFIGGVHGVDGFDRGGDGIGQRLGMELGRRCFGRGGLLRLGYLGRDNGFGSDCRSGRGRLVFVVVMVVPMIVLAITMMMVIMFMFMFMFMFVILVPMFIMIVIMVIVSFERVVMLRFGLQMLALVRCALGVLRQHLERLGGGISAGLEALDDVALDALAMAATTGIAVARAAAVVGTVLVLLLGLAMSLLLGLDQRLPIGNRDLVVVGMDFAEGKEAVAVAAIFDEGGLEGRFDPCDLGEIDIAAQLLALRGLEIKLFDAIAADHDDPGLFRVGGIDQHLVGHVLTLGGGGRDSPWAR